MKKIAAIVILLALVSAGAYWYFSNMGGSEAEVSPDQMEIRDFLGMPAQFSISYLPQGEAGEFVRSETWYFPDSKKEVRFLGGEIFSSQDYAPVDGMKVTDLVPEQFDVNMTVADINKVLGEQATLFEVPGVTTDVVKTYVSSKVMFTIENDYLTYITTLSTNAIPTE